MFQPPLSFKTLFSQSFPSRKDKTRLHCTSAAIMPTWPEAKQNNTTNPGVLSGQVAIKVEVFPKVISHWTAQLWSALTPNQLEYADQS